MAPIGSPVCGRDQPGKRMQKSPAKGRACRRHDMGAGVASASAHPASPPSDPAGSGEQQGAHPEAHEQDGAGDADPLERQLVGPQLASSTTGTLASIMPRVVPVMTWVSESYLAASSTVAIWVLSPIRR